MKDKLLKLLFDQTNEFPILNQTSGFLDKKFEKWLEILAFVRLLWNKDTALRLY